MMRITTRNENQAAAHTKLFSFMISKWLAEPSPLH
jgi:hypothetical protein